MREGNEHVLTTKRSSLKLLGTVGEPLIKFGSGIMMLSVIKIVRSLILGGKLKREVS